MGSATAELRSGPSIAGASVIRPPKGTGSLNISVATKDDKVAWGNEVDFAGQDFLSTVTAVGFDVYNVGENVKYGGTAVNMPSIIFEIDPNIGTAANAEGTGYSSLVYMPTTQPAGWSHFNAMSDTSGLWGLTGGQFAGTKCDINFARCTWSEIVTFLSNAEGDTNTKLPVILTAAISKGRDFQFHGAVDALQIGNKVYDFEEHGVVETTV